MRVTIKQRQRATVRLKSVSYSSATKATSSDPNSNDTKFSTPADVVSRAKSGSWQQINSPAILTIDAKLKRGYADVRDFSSYAGGMGTGTRDDTSDLNTAVGALTEYGGGKIILRPTGNPYRTTASVTLGNGIKLVGDGTTRFSGATAANSGWTQEGSWLKPEHPTQPAVVLGGHGSAIEGVSFIHDQPTPTGSSWTPNTYGYCISVNTSHTSVERVRAINGYNGVEFAYTDTSGGGTEVRMRDVMMSCFGTRLRTSMVNDTMYAANFHGRNLWYSSDARVVAWLRANTIGWDCGYTDNIMFSGLEFFEEKTSILFRDETCLGNTHSLYNGTLVNLQFNLPQICMKVENGTTTVDAMITNLKQQTGNAFGYTWADTALQLNSDNVNFDVTNWSVVDAGGRIMEIGNGAGGRWSATGYDIRNYSTVSSGQVAIAQNAGAQVGLFGRKRFNKPSGAGTRIAGAGSESVKTDAYDEIALYDRYSVATGTLNGSWQDLGTDLQSRPGVGTATQCRLLGNINITSAASGTLSVRLSGVAAALASGISTSSTGFKNIDSGWVDIAQADLDSLTNWGRWQINGTSGVQWSNGSLSLLIR